MAQQQDMGLFGVPSASDILRQQQQQDQMLAMRQAQLAPGQGLMYQAASAGQRAGRSIAGLFGIEDPALKEATEMDAVKKAVASQWDGSDPEKALELFVQEANKRGFTSQALKASEKLTDLRMKKEEKEAIIGLRKAQTTEAQRKGEAAGQEKRPEFVRLQEERNRLQQLFNMSTDDAEKEALAAQIAEISKYLGKQSSFAPTAPKEDKSLIKVGVSTSGQIVYLNPNTNKQVIIDAKGEQVPYSGAVRESAGTKVDVSINQDKGINAAKVKKLDDLENSAVAADSVIGNVNTISNVLNNAFTGVGAGAVLKAGQIANALGVQVTGTTETEQLNQLLAKLAQGQARTLPGSLSEKELMFLREAIGTGGMTRQTLQAMLRRMREDAIADKEAYKDAFKFQQGGGNLNNYDFAESRTKARTNARRISELLEKATPEQRRQLGY